MDRTAVFVDAGYLFAAGSVLLTGQKLPRGQLDLDYDAVLSALAALSAELTRLPLLRIYWYDGTASGPTSQQLALAYRPNVKLRLGLVNSHGEQKGVDSLVVSDLLNLSRNRAMADAVLLTGDEDLRIGVQQAQEYGVRVHLVGVAPARENQSGFLVQEADTTRELGLEEVQRFLSRAAPWVPPPLEPPAADAGDEPAPQGPPLLVAARRMVEELRPEEREAILHQSTGGSVPTQLDRRLLFAGSHALGGAALSPEQKRALRQAFLELCRRARAEPSE